MNSYIMKWKQFEEIFRRVKHDYNTQSKISTRGGTGVFILLIAVLLQLLTLRLASEIDINRYYSEAILFTILIIAVCIIFFSRWSNLTIRDKLLDDLFYLRTIRVDNSKFNDDEIRFINQFLKMELDYKKIKRLNYFKKK